MKDSNNLQLYTYTKSKWNYRSPSVDNHFKANVTSSGFKTKTFSQYSENPTADVSWAKNNMYRTSYNDMKHPALKVCYK